MNIISIKPVDGINGPGVRCSIWIAGCNNKCEGCWSPKTWNPNQGKSFKNSIKEIILDISNINIDGVAILGGDPFYYIMNGIDSELLDLLLIIRNNLKHNQNIWLWTGYTLDEIKANPLAYKCFKLIDFAVINRFELDKRDLTLPFRGSSNQQIINCNTLEDITAQYK
jgi:anaerobic ribonucleoside-triphosphate reductase activating protein